MPELILALLTVAKKHVRRAKNLRSFAQKPFFAAKNLRSFAQKPFFAAQHTHADS
jgi:hypothetical protein